MNVGHLRVAGVYLIWSQLYILNLNQGYFAGDSLTKPPFGVTSAEVSIISPDHLFLFMTPSNSQIHDVEVVSISRQQIAQDTVIDGALFHGNPREPPQYQPPPGNKVL